MIALMRIRQSKGLTQRRLAEMSGVTQQNISLIERGDIKNLDDVWVAQTRRRMCLAGKTGARLGKMVCNRYCRI